MGDSLVAIVGAVLGGLFGALGGVVAARWTVFAESRVEHEQWLRDRRMEAYVDLLGAYATCGVQLRDYVGNDNLVRLDAVSDVGMVDRWVRVFGEVENLVAPARAAVDLARLVGPEDVKDACGSLIRALEAARVATIAQADRCHGFNDDALKDMQSADRAFRACAETVIATPPALGKGWRHVFRVSRRGVDGS